VGTPGKGSGERSVDCSKVQVQPGKTESTAQDRAGEKQVLDPQGISYVSQGDVFFVPLENTKLRSTSGIRKYWKMSATVRLQLEFKSHEFVAWFIINVLKTPSRLTQSCRL